MKNGASVDELAITKEGEIVVGKFVDRERPDYAELMRNRLSEQLGDRYEEPHICETECSTCS